MLPRSPSSETTKPPSPASCAMASAPSRSTSRPFRSSSLLSPRRSTSALRHHSRRPGRRGEPSGRRKQGASCSSDPELLVGSAPTAPPVTTESPAGAGLSPTGATGLEPATPGFGDVERECCLQGKGSKIAGARHCARQSCAKRPEGCCLTGQRATVASGRVAGLRRSPYGRKRWIAGERPRFSPLAAVSTARHLSAPF